jgi:lysophospholipase L1-like esterase
MHAASSIRTLLLATLLLSCPHAAQAAGISQPALDTMPNSLLFQPKDRVLFEGDSLTDGLKNNYGRQMGWDKTWAHRVDEWLFTHRPELNLEFKNLAVGGSSTRTLLTRTEADAAFKPTVVLFTMGTNDAIIGIPLDEFRKNLSDWCAAMKKAGAREIILVGGFAPCPNVDDETRAILEKCTPYWQAGREVVEAHGGRFLDVGPYMLARAQALDQRWKKHTVYSSGVHYNALGNELIAGAVLTQLGYWREF